MDLAQVYQQIEQRLDTMDFSALHAGFSRFPFALYDEKQAFMDGEYFDRPAEFMGNTSVRFRGAHTAIWKLSQGPMDMDELAAKLVHEMLHAYQQAMGETRWADEREALVRYRYDPANVSARLEEAACMEACLSGRAPEQFARLLALRKARSERFPYAYDYEARIEQIEGTAHYVELCALHQLSPQKAKERWAQLFTALKDPARYFPVRSVTYLSGAAVIACLKQYTDLDTDRMTDTPFALSMLQSVKPCALPPTDARTEKCLENWRGQSRETVEKALQKGEMVLDGAYRLVMWNVYDAQWDGTYAVITAFLGYIEGTALPKTDEELFACLKILNGNFVAQVDETFLLSRVWRLPA